MHISLVIRDTPRRCSAATASTFEAQQRVMEMRAESVGAALCVIGGFANDTMLVLIAGGARFVRLVHQGMRSECPAEPATRLDIAGQYSNGSSARPTDVIAEEPES